MHEPRLCGPPLTLLWVYNIPCIRVSCLNADLCWSTRSKTLRENPSRRPPAYGKAARGQLTDAAAPAEPLYLVTYDYRDRAIGRCTGTADLSSNQQSRREVAEQIARGLIPGAERCSNACPARAAPIFPRTSPATP